MPPDSRASMFDEEKLQLSADRRHFIYRGRAVIFNDDTSALGEKSELNLNFW